METVDIPKTVPDFVQSCLDRELEPLFVYSHCDSLLTKETLVKPTPPTSHPSPNQNALYLYIETLPSLRQRTLRKCEIMTSPIVKLIVYVELYISLRRHSTFRYLLQYRSTHAIMVLDYTTKFSSVVSSTPRAASSPLKASKCKFIDFFTNFPRFNYL